MNGIENFKLERKEENQADSILVFGGGGLVGSRFLELRPKKDISAFPRRSELDITVNDNVRHVVENVNPTCIINFAADIDVTKAEKQRGNKNGSTWNLNVNAVRNILDVMDPSKTRFIQISTDMVFSGSDEDPGPYGEDHQPENDSSKVTWYGWTKAEAERLVTDKLGDRAIILRIISPVRARYDRKLDYLRKPLKLFDEGKLYPLFTDQQVSIAFIDEICLALDKIIAQKVFGVFHASCPDTASPFELVSYLLEKARGVTDVVKPASLNEYLKTVDNPVRYPKFGGLNVEETEKKLGIKFSTWREIIVKLVDQNISY